MELLSDPLNDRVVKDVPLPPQKPLSQELMYPYNDEKGQRSNIPDFQMIKKHLCQEGRLRKDLLLKLVSDVNQIHDKEPNLVRIKGKIVIIGDIHGQYYDLAHLHDKMPQPPSAHLLFLGDYVDRGLYSIEVLAFLYALKMNFPNNVTLLRGNHEARSMTEFFTFRDECLRKFDTEVYDAIMESFDLMPIAAIANDEYFCMHGGISPHLNKISDVNDIDRKIEPPIDGLLCDLLWSDPIDDIYANMTEFKDNPERECSYYFGNQPVKDLLREHGMVSIIRAHQVQLEGYKMHKWNGMSNFPSVITIFSAPDYGGFHSNSGAIIILKEDKMQIKQFRETASPYHLPNDLDLINWSMPYLANKVIQLLYHIVSQNQDYTPSSYELENIDFTKLNQVGKDKFERSEILRTKVKAVAKLARMFKNLQTNSDILLEIKEMAPDGKIPRGLLMKGRPAMKDKFKEFLLARDLDKENEKRPLSPHRTPITPLSKASADSLLIQF